jgi:hypothetical protein
MVWRRREAEAARSNTALCGMRTTEREVTNMKDHEIVCGDNLRVLSERQDVRPVMLAYLDPPFRTGSKKSGPAGEYHDPMVPMQQFVEGIVRVAASCKMHMAYEGSLVVHVDPKTSHYVKVGLDKYFGDERFASEIIWRYRRWPSKQQNFQRVHDVLLRYVMNPGWQCWNQLYEPPSPSTLATWGTGKQCAVVVGGKRKRSSVSEEPSPGVPMGDVWDISIVAPVAHERTGWPTQKPEALLERLILATTDPGDLVLDPFCGSGTSIAVAKRLGRRAFGIDQNPDAVQVSEQRLKNQH